MQVLNIQVSISVQEQLEDCTLGKGNSDKKEVPVSENKYRADKWQVLPEAFIWTQAYVPVFQLAGHKSPSLPAWSARHFLWLQRHFSSQIHIHFLLEAKVHLSFSLSSQMEARMSYAFVMSSVDHCSSLSGYG